jgi:hypothetical protein
MTTITYAITIGPASSKLFLSKLDTDIDFTENELEALRFDSSTAAEGALYAVEQMTMEPAFISVLP